MLHHRENHVGPDHSDQVLSNLPHPPNSSKYMTSELHNKDIQAFTTPSSGLTTRLLPYKNARGEIEWAFTEDLAAYRHAQEATGSSYPYAPLLLPEDDFDVELNDDDIDIGYDYDAPKPNANRLPHQENSPSEASSQNNPHSQDQHQGQIPFAKQEMFFKSESSSSKSPEPRASPTSVNPRDSKRNSQTIKSESKALACETPPASSNTPVVPTEDNIFRCPECLVVFKIRGYLTRHMKLHSDKKAYTCPFNLGSPDSTPDKESGTRCRHNGGFARRDTYKTHLKSRHFSYPQGIKNKDRLRSPGWCSMCGLKFPNAEIWAEIHIEGHECQYLPPLFSGRSRFRDNLIKNLSDSQRQQLQRNGGILLPEMYKQALGGEYSQKDSLGGEESPYAETPTSDNPNSPAPIPSLTETRREEDTRSDAPAFGGGFREMHSEYGGDMQLIDAQHAHMLNFESPVHQQVAGLEEFGDAFRVESDHINAFLNTTHNTDPHSTWGVSPHMEGTAGPFPQDLQALFSQHSSLPLNNDTNYNIPAASQFSANLLDASLEQYRIDPEFSYDELGALHPQSTMHMDYSRYPNGFNYSQQ